MHVLYEITHTIDQDDDSWEDTMTWKQELKLLAASENLSLLEIMRKIRVEKQDGIYAARQEYHKHMDKTSPTFAMFIKDSQIIDWFSAREEALGAFEKNCVEAVNLISKASEIPVADIISYSRREYEIQNVEVL